MQINLIEMENEMKNAFFRMNGIKKVGATLCMLLAFFFIFVIGVSAADDGFVSSKTMDQDIYIYVRGTDGVTDAKVNIGNSSCDNVEVQSIRQSGTPIRTILMFDSTISMKNAFGSNAIELFSQMIDQHAENEEFKIVTFADDAVDLTDFSTDYEALKSALQSFQYAKGDTYLSKSLYNLIKKNTDSSFSGYYRIVIISDGVEDDAVSYTTAELNSLLADSGMVLHAIGINQNSSADTLKELFYLARSSGGKSIVADNKTDYQTIIDLFNEDYSIYCVRVSPSMDLCDGSRKDVKIELIGGTEATQAIGTVRMPFGDGTKEEIVPEEEPEVEEDEEDKPSIPVIGPKTEEKKEDDDSGLKIVVIIIIIIAGILVLLGGGLLAFLLIKKKKDAKKQEESERIAREQRLKEQKEKEQKAKMEAAARNSNQKSDKPFQSSGKTVMLWGTGKKYLVLKSRTGMCGDYKIEMKDSVIIGRAKGDIIIGQDSSVSSEHCMISKKGELYYLKDLDSTNGTYCNGMLIKDEVPIMAGTILKIGKCEFEIGFEQG